jgi:hypothetical protein
MDAEIRKGKGKHGKVAYGGQWRKGGRGGGKSNQIRNWIMK